MLRLTPKLHLQPNCTNKGLCGSRDYSSDFDVKKDCIEKRCKYYCDLEALILSNIPEEELLEFEVWE